MAKKILYAVCLIIGKTSVNKSTPTTSDFDAGIVSFNEVNLLGKKALRKYLNDRIKEIA